MKIKAMSLVMLLVTLGCKTIPKADRDEDYHHHDKYTNQHNNHTHDDRAYDKHSEHAHDDQHKNVLEEEIFATATLEPKSGTKAHGKAILTKTAHGIQITVSVENVSPGEHAIHVHEHGDCSALDASSAGEHYNPTKSTHGSPNSPNHHIGDYGNITINADGTGTLNLKISEQDESIIGKSLVLHKNADDFTTQPSGNSGDRIACGIITKP